MINLPIIASSRSTLFALKLALALGLIFWLFHSGRLDFSLLLNLPFSWLFLLGLASLAVSVFLQIFRWWLLLCAQEQALEFTETLNITLVGQFFAAVLPGSLGGDAVRVYYMVKDSRQGRLKRVSTVLIDRAIGLYAMLIMGVGALIVLWLEGQAESLLHFCVLLVGSLIAMTLVALLAYVMPGALLLTRFIPARWRQLFREVISSYFQSPLRLLLHCGVLSLLINIVLISTFLVAGQLVGVKLSWAQAFMVVPLVTIAHALPLTPLGIGVSEAVAALLFGKFGVNSGAEIFIIIRIWDLLLRLPGGIIFAYSLWREKDNAFVNVRH